MTETRLQGVAASNGIAIGPAYCYRLPDLSIPKRAFSSAEQELGRFQEAVQAADAELQALYDLMKSRAGEKDAAIFDAHHMMLHDPTLAKKIRKSVEGGQIVEQAVLTAVELALEAGAPTKTHILNVLHRLIDGKPIAAPPVKPPNALTLTTEPQANVERYDALRKAREARHAS